MDCYYDGPAGTLYMDGQRMENAGPLEVTDLPVLDTDTDTHAGCFKPRVFTMQVRMKRVCPMEAIERSDMHAYDKMQVDELMMAAMNHANEGGHNG